MPRSISFIRWCGLAAILGGALWVIGNVIHAFKPQGCIAEECAFRPMRDTSALEGILMLLSLMVFEAAMPLFAVGLLGLYARLDGRGGPLGKAGVLVACAALAAAVLIRTLLRRGGIRSFPRRGVGGERHLQAGIFHPP